VIYSAFLCTAETLTMPCELSHGASAREPVRERGFAVRLCESVEIWTASIPPGRWYEPPAVPQSSGVRYRILLRRTELSCSPALSETRLPSGFRGPPTRVGVLGPLPRVRKPVPSSGEEPVAN